MDEVLSFITPYLEAVGMVVEDRRQPVKWLKRWHSGRSSGCRNGGSRALLTLSAENTGFTAFRPLNYGLLKDALLRNPIKSKVKVNNALASLDSLQLRGGFRRANRRVIVLAFGDDCSTSKPSIAFIVVIYKQVFASL
jgi:hypothetical protein